MAFRFALVTPDNEPYDPAVFMTAEPRWSMGDVVILGPDKRFRILDIAPPTAEARAEADIVAVWTVQQVWMPFCAVLPGRLTVLGGERTKVRGQGHRPRPCWGADPGRRGV